MGGTPRRQFPIVDRDGFAGPGVVYEHEATAANVARARQGNGQREPHCHRGIDGIAAVSEYLSADLGRQGVLRGDHAGRPEDRVTQVFVTNDRGI